MTIDMIEEVVQPLRGLSHNVPRDPEVLVCNLCERGSTVHLETGDCTVFVVTPGGWYVREFRFNTNFARDTFLTFYQNEFQKRHGRKAPRILEAP
jgi:hypothetical protein